MRGKRQPPPGFMPGESPGQRSLAGHSPWGHTESDMSHVESCSHAERAVGSRATIVTKRIKYLGINLPKETKELYMENYKTLMKEIKDDINR